MFLWFLWVFDIFWCSFLTENFCAFTCCIEHIVDPHHLIKNLIFDGADGHYIQQITQRVRIVISNISLFFLSLRFDTIYTFVIDVIIWVWSLLYSKHRSVPYQESRFINSFYESSDQCHNLTGFSIIRSEDKNIFSGVFLTWQNNTVTNYVKKNWCS